MMTKENVESKCRGIIKTQLDVEGFDNTAELISDLNADTLDMIEICMECEADFMVTIPDTDWEKVVTFQDMVNVCFEAVNRNTDVVQK